MPHDRRHGHVRRRATRRGSKAASLLLAAAFTVALAALSGVWIGRAAAPEAPDPPPANRAVDVGPALIVVPAAWRAAPLESTGIAGLEKTEGAAAFAPTPGHPARVVATFAPADDASLIPAALRAALGDRLARPSTTGVGRRLAWLYRGPTEGWSGRRTDVAVLATTSGMLAIACTSPASQWPAGFDCVSELRSAAVPGATTLVPSESLALGMHLPAVVSRLDRDRRSHRAALNRASSGRYQALAAGRLVAVHSTAATALRPAAGDAGAPLLQSLTRAGDAYRALGRAATNGWPRRYLAARHAVQRAEAQLTTAIADVPRPAAARIAPAAAAPRAADTSSPPSGGVTPLIFLLLALVAAGVGIAAGTTGAASWLWRSVLVAKR